MDAEEFSQEIKMNPSFFFLGSLFSFMVTGACAWTTSMRIMRKIEIGFLVIGIALLCAGGLNYLF